MVQLFELEMLQRQLNLPSKCGIEKRAHVHGLYGGYFYNESKEEGVSCYNIVYAAMSQNEILRPLLDFVDEEGRTQNLLLKRACTEFEHLCGDSSKWEVTQEQLAIESLVNRYVVADDFERIQPEILVRHVRRTWIEFAYQWADPTYAQLTGGEPLYPHYVTYHQEEKRNENGKERKTSNNENDTESGAVDNKRHCEKGSNGRAEKTAKRDKKGRYTKKRGAKNGNK